MCASECWQAFAAHRVKPTYGSWTSWTKRETESFEQLFCLCSQKFENRISDIFNLAKWEKYTRAQLADQIFIFLLSSSRKEEHENETLILYIILYSFLCYFFTFFVCLFWTLSHSLLFLFAFSIHVPYWAAHMRPISSLCINKCISLICNAPSHDPIYKFEIVAKRKIKVTNRLPSRHWHDIRQIFVCSQKINYYYISLQYKCIIFNSPRAICFFAAVPFGIHWIHTFLLQTKCARNYLQQQQQELEKE